MTRETEENKAIVRSYLERIFNQGDLSATEEYFREGKVDFNGILLDVRQVYDYWHKAFPDARIMVEHQIAEGEWVATRVTFEGTHLGSYKGIAPTGKKASWSGIAMDRIVGDKVVEMRHEADELGLLRSLGASLHVP